LSYDTNAGQTNFSQLPSQVSLTVSPRRTGQLLRVALKSRMPRRFFRGHRFSLKSQRNFFSSSAASRFRFARDFRLNLRASGALDFCSSASSCGLMVSRSQPASSWISRGCGSLRPLSRWRGRTFCSRNKFPSRKSRRDLRRAQILFSPSPYAVHDAATNGEINFTFASAQATACASENSRSDCS